MEHIVDVAAKARLAAREEYSAVLDQLAPLETRLCKAYNAKLAFKKRPPREKCKEIVDACGSIEAQIKKVRESAKEAKDVMHNEIDAANATVVESIRGLCSYGVGTGQGGAGMRYLLTECQEFGKVKGYEARSLAYDSCLRVLNALGESLAETDEYDSGVLRDLESIEDPEARSHFFNKHKDEIHAVYDSQINRATKQEGGSTENTGTDAIR